MTVVERICQLMEEEKISGCKLQTACGLSNSAVTQWKARKTYPSAESLIKIADYFNVSVDYLLGRGKNQVLKENQRRKRAELRGLYKEIEVLKAGLKRCVGVGSDYLDNLPEDNRTSESGKRLEDAFFKVSYAINYLGGALSSIECALNPK